MRRQRIIPVVLRKAAAGMFAPAGQIIDEALLAVGESPVYDLANRSSLLRLANRHRPRVQFATSIASVVFESFRGARTLPVTIVLIRIQESQETESSPKSLPPLKRKQQQMCLHQQDKLLTKPYLL